jgi:hypothetical protein
MKLPHFKATKVLQPGAEVSWEASVMLDGEEYGRAKDPYKSTAVQRACEQALQRLDVAAGSEAEVGATSSDDEGGPQQQSAGGAGPGTNALVQPSSEEQSALSNLIMRFEADTGLFSKRRTLANSQ